MKVVRIALVAASVTIVLFFVWYTIRFPGAATIGTLVSATSFMLATLALILREEDEESKQGVVPEPAQDWSNLGAVVHDELRRSRDALEKIHLRQGRMGKAILVASVPVALLLVRRRRANGQG